MEGISEAFDHIDAKDLVRRSLFLSLLVSQGSISASKEDLEYLREPLIKQIEKRLKSKNAKTYENSKTMALELLKNHSLRENEKLV